MRIRLSNVLISCQRSPYPMPTCTNLPCIDSFRLSNRAISDYLLPIDNRGHLMRLQRFDKFIATLFSHVILVYSTKQGSLLNQIMLLSFALSIWLMTRCASCYIYIIMSVIFINVIRHLMLLKKILNFVNKAAIFWWNSKCCIFAGVILNYVDNVVKTYRNVLNILKKVLHHYAKSNMATIFASN